MTCTKFFCLSLGLTLLISGCAGKLIAPEIEAGHPAHANTITGALPSDALRPLDENPFAASSSEKKKGSSSHQNHGGNR